MEVAGASPAVLAIGNFDGVHLGHQELLAAGTKLARSSGAELVAITFEPHPRQVLGPDRSVSLLTPLRCGAGCWRAMGSRGWRSCPSTSTCSA